jgi:hypothetical protein
MFVQRVAGRFKRAELRVGKVEGREDHPSLPTVHLVALFSPASPTVCRSPRRGGV